MASIPEPCYTLIETSKAGDPAIVVVNSALLSFKDRSLFPWHLALSIRCEHLGENGMPAPEEVKILDQIEDEIFSLLLSGQNAVFLARVTCQGQRNLMYRVREPEDTNRILGELISRPGTLREWDYRIERDDAWDLARPELSLLDRSRN